MKDCPKWGDFVNGVKHFPLHEAQHKILTSPKRLRLFLGGVGSGKTSCGALDLLRHVQSNPTGTFLVVAPTNKILDSATIPTWERTVAGTDFQTVYIRSRNVIELPTGGMIYFRSCYDSKGSYTGSCEGIQADYAWVDEAGQLPSKAWAAVVRRCANRNAPIFLSSTPYTFNWLKKDFHDKALAGDPNYEVVTCKSNDNPGFSQESFEVAKEATREHEFKMFYEAQWARASGLVYPDCQDWIVDELPDNLAGEWVGGIDFGHHRFAALAGVVDHHDTLWLCYERYLGGLDIMQHGEALANLPVDIRWYCDSANPDQIRLLRRQFALNARAVKKGAGSINFGINVVTHLGKTGHIKISRDHCPNLIMEAESYAYDERDGELCDRIDDGQRDHALDSLRYLCVSKFKRVLGHLQAPQLKAYHFQPDNKEKYKSDTDEETETTGNNIYRQVGRSASGV